METSDSVNKVAFNKLIDLFIKRSEHLYILDNTLGKGYIQLFDLEKGLQVRFWNFCFFKEVEIYNSTDSADEDAYFNLAFFLTTQGLLFTTIDTFLQKNTIWDTVFISNASHYRIYMSAMARGHCLSISFSKRWLENAVFKDNELFEDLHRKINATNSIAIHEFMNAEDKKQVAELMDVTWKKSLGSFYIKSYVLRLICNFFYRIRERENIDYDELPIESIINRVENYLTNHITEQLPDLRYLSDYFSISESTLKRHFKKKNGMNMSTYFICKKMEYASQLMRNKKLRINEVSSLLGYKNVNNFKSMLKKYSIH